MIVCPDCDLQVSSEGNLVNHLRACGQETAGALRKRRQRWRERPLPKVQDPDPSWRLRAACRNKPTVNWFPEHPAGPLPADSQYRRDVQAAKAICNDECNVRGSCLQFALSTRQDYGIFGGRTEREREHLLKRGRVS